MQTITQVPGIRFETQPPPAADSLPRMDIAAFVGFASRGPLHIPVAVEDIVRFRDIFGDDLPIAWNRSERRMEYSYLGPSVEAFFRSGGRRCWVVRVADESARTNTFALPGLVGVNGPFVEETVLARSRCPGSWSDGLRIGAVLQTTQLVVTKAEACIREEGKLLEPCQCRVDLPGLHPDMRPGDLVRITFPDHGDILFLFIAGIAGERGGIRINGTRGYWFCPGGETDPAGPDPLFISSDGWRLYLLSDTVQLGREFVWPGESPEAKPPRASMLRFAMSAWRNGVREHTVSNLAFSGLHPRFWRYLPDDATLFRPAGGRPQPIVPQETSMLLKEASEPRRFPIAGPEEPDESPGRSEDTRCYLPINMPGLIDPDLAAGPEAGDDNKRPLEREGLARFNSQLFLDHVLADTGIGFLLQEAEQRYSLSASPAAPRGIHSLLPIEEVTLLAVPDAVHRQWSRAAPKLEDLPEAPLLEPITPEEASGRRRAAWTKVAGATSYILHYDTSPEFTNAISLVIQGETVERVGQPPDLLPEPDTSFVLAMPDDCPRTHYFRVRAERLGTVSAWSNTRTTIVPFREFSLCNEGRPDLLELMLEQETAGPPPGDIRLSWTLSNQVAASPAAGDEVFELSRAVDIEFQSAQQVYRGSSPGFTTSIPVDEVAYYRVRAWSGDIPGPWSNTIRLNPATVSLDTLQTASEYDDSDLLNIHQALIRMCAARGDMMTVLSLPRHYRTTETLEHVAVLTASGEERVPSYAALYHPWLAARGQVVPDRRTAGSQVMFSPPDGAITGAIAGRTRERGAWIAPANETLPGAVALDPDLNHDEWRQLMSAGVNVLRRDPRGFLVLSAETLSPDEDLRPINVRRLLILLRRLAHREGTRFVFEPNDDDFQSGVRRQFEQLLSGLYMRGAFAGRNAGEAYRVVADSSVNTQESLDQGRFIVELRVAPSQPLQFLTIRLAQSGPDDLRFQEV